MANPNNIVLITGNTGKVAEFERLLGTALKHKQLELPEIQTTDVKKVARAKAQQAYSLLDKPCLVDDTGLTIDAWGELPGALIRWFLDNLGNDGILTMLAPGQPRTARVTTALGYCDKNGVQVFSGELLGSIANEPRGDNGFGYDPIFVPDGQYRTLAQMTSDQKDALSMRAAAAKAMREKLGLDADKIS